MENKNFRIVARVDGQERVLIERKAKKVGLSTSEYVRQRAMNYEPRPIPPEAFFRLCEEYDKLVVSPDSPVNRSRMLAALKHLIDEVGGEVFGNDRVLASKRAAKRHP